MDGIETERDLSLDSTFFVAFDLTHRALKSGLAQASSLSVTQYRVLVKLLSAAPSSKPPSRPARASRRHRPARPPAVSPLRARSCRSSW